MFVDNANTPSKTIKWLDGEGNGKSPDLERVSPIFLSTLAWQER